MESTKLGLSEEERRLVTDPGIILTKNAIIAKVYDLFGVLSEEQKGMGLPEEASLVSPKISKGENYKGLPYVMLDYPRLFSATHVLAIRTHFWWGNYFSVTLHLKGSYHEQLRPALADQYDALSAQGQMLCIAEDEWEHELKQPFYAPVSAYSKAAFEQMLLTMPFVKIARQFSLEDWDHMQFLLGNAQRELCRIIRISYPGGATGH